MKVIQTTDVDDFTDNSVAVADYTMLDGTGMLLMTHIKSLYEKANDNELLVGDVVNPYLTIAYCSMILKRTHGLRNIILISN